MARAACFCPPAIPRAFPRPEERLGLARNSGDCAVMRSMKLAAAALAAICFAPVCLSPGAARADAAAGARMALQWCANCHVVNSGGSGPSAPIPQGPPAFQHDRRPFEPRAAARLPVAPARRDAGPRADARRDQRPDRLYRDVEVEFARSRCGAMEVATEATGC